MKKLLLLSMISCVSLSANAMDLRQYASAKANYNLMHADVQSDGLLSQKLNDHIMGVNLAYGIQMNNTFRVEMEGYYNDTAKDDLNILGIVNLPTELKTKGFFLNGYLDLPLDNPAFKPYATAGIGYSWLKGTIKSPIGDFQSKDDGFSWNAGIGIGYALNSNWIVDVGYRYENLGKIKDQGDNIEIKNNKFSLGLRYEF